MTRANDENETDAGTTAVADPPHWLRNVVLFLSGQTVSLLGSMLVQYAVFWYLTITYQSGLVTNSGRSKPALFAYALPFVVFPSGPGTIGTSTRSCSRPGWCFWKLAARLRIGCMAPSGPGWLATTRRLEKLPPSSWRSTDS